MVDILLDSERRQIANTDQQIALLCQQRIVLAEKIFKLKKKYNCPVVDAAQEQEVCLRYTQILAEDTTTERVHNFVNSLIRLSKTYPGQTKEIL